MVVQTWRQYSAGLSHFEVEIELGRIFSGGCLDAPNVGVQGRSTLLMKRLHGAQAMPELHDFPSPTGNDHVLRFVVALKSSAYPYLTYVKVASTRRDADGGMDEVMQLIRTVAAVKKGCCKKKSTFCFSCGMNGYIASRFPLQTQRPTSTSRSSSLESSKKEMIFRRGERRVNVLVSLPSPSLDLKTVASEAAIRSSAHHNDTRKQ